MTEELLMEYMDRLVEDTYGTDDYRKIMKILGDVENGFCGCEMYFSTFPRLLAAKGVTPARSYIEEYGEPPQDGQSAATIVQREIILARLRGAGFTV